MKKKYYIAYGSNLNLRQMSFRCPDAQVAGTSFIEDYELLFKGSKTGAYLTIEPRAGARVPVAVWAVSPADEAALDRYEGFPVFYYKKDLRLPVMDTETGEVTDRDCFVYIMHENRPVGIPSRFYVKTCLEGYVSFGFDESPLAEAYRNACREVHGE